MLKLDGKMVRDERLNVLVGKVEKVGGAKLHIFLVGEDSSSQAYVRQKVKFAAKVGITAEVIHIAKPNADTLKKNLAKSIGDKTVHGIIVQLPLPGGLKEKEFIDLIPAVKDVDCLSMKSVGYFYAGQPIHTPCTPGGIMSLLGHYEIGLKGKRVVIAGRSRLVGLPLFILMLRQHATVGIIHSRIENQSEIIREADVFVAAVGKKHLYNKDQIKKGAILIDVGINVDEVDGKRKLFGDIDPAGVEDIAEAMTPVPGGVGPMTVATLLENTLRAKEYLSGQIPVME